MLIGMETLRARLGLSDIRLLADCPVNDLGSVEAMRKAAGDEGLSCLILSAEDHELHRRMARETWAYVYDKEKLQAFLDQNKDMLAREEWPQQADDFIFYLTAVYAPAHSELFDMIHACYGNDITTSDNGWLRRNTDKAQPFEIAAQHHSAEFSRQWFKVVYQDDAKAAQWFLDLAKTGHMGAMQNVSRIYEDGMGFKKNRVEAAFWHDLVEAMRALHPPKTGLPSAFARCAAPDFRLTADEQAQVKTRIAAWLSPAPAQPKPPSPQP